MKLRRILRHLLAPAWVVRRAFPRAALERIEQAIRRSESSHRGELRVAMEGALALPALLRGLGSRERALELFGRLRVWDTEERSGVLIYLQLAERRIEIVADRGISARVAQAEWDAICRRMEGAFRERRFEEGLLEAIGEITQLLARHFPARGANPDELPDRPVVL